MSDDRDNERFSLSAPDQQALLDVARQSIAEGLRTGRPLVVEPAAYPATLQDLGAAFVTLKREGQLRGCIGSVTPSRPLVQDVAMNAFAAAFQDPRFPPLHPTEYDHLEYQISVLGPLTPIPLTDEAAILEQLRPGQDGLVIEYGTHRGLFLPSVWSSLPDRRQFFAALKQKAGLPPDFWSPDVRVLRFETFAFG